MGDILGAYPELTDSYKSLQLQKMYDEGLDVEEDLYYPDKDHLRRDTDDEQEDDDEGFSTPPSSDYANNLIMGFMRDVMKSCN